MVSRQTMVKRFIYGANAQVHELLEKRRQGVYEYNENFFLQVIFQVFFCNSEGSWSSLLSTLLGSAQGITSMLSKPTWVFFLRQYEFQPHQARKYFHG